MANDRDAHMCPNPKCPGGPLGVKTPHWQKFKGFAKGLPPRGPDFKCGQPVHIHPRYREMEEQRRRAPQKVRQK